MGQPLSDSYMLGTRTKLDRAIAVVIALHGKIANAKAVSAAFVLMPVVATPVFVHQFSPMAA
jgi:phosphoribosylcarboxyaminoimidazole (NCAIR) mutase